MVVLSLDFIIVWKLRQCACSVNSRTMGWDVRTAKLANCCFCCLRTARNTIFTPISSHCVRNLFAVIETKWPSSLLDHAMHCCQTKMWNKLPDETLSLQCHLPQPNRLRFPAKTFPMPETMSMDRRVCDWNIYENKWNYKIGLYSHIKHENICCRLVRRPTHLSFRSSLFRLRNVAASIWSDSPWCSYNWDNCCVKSDTIADVIRSMKAKRTYASRGRVGRRYIGSIETQWQRKEERKKKQNAKNINNKSI